MLCLPHVAQEVVLVVLVKRVVWVDQAGKVVLAEMGSGVALWVEGRGDLPEWVEPVELEVMGEMEVTAVMVVMVVIFLFLFLTIGMEM